MPGCRKAAKPKGDYCSDAHRAGAHKLRKRMGGMLPAERKRAADAAAKRVARAERVIPSDVRLAYEKAVRVLAEGLAVERGAVRCFVPGTVLPSAVPFPAPEPIDFERAERLLAPALPESKRPEMVPVSGEEAALGAAA